MKTVFKKHPHLESYFETADGVKFFTKHTAQAHARSLKEKKVNEVRKGVSGKQPAPKTVGNKTFADLEYHDRMKAIEKMESVEAIEKALKDETAKTVKEAGAKRMAALKASDALKEKDNANVQTQE